VTDNLILALQIYGLAILVSMAVAVAIKAIVSGLSRLQSPEKARKASVAVIDDDLIPVEHIAAISAAAYSMLGRHRIVHIEDRGRGRSWMAEGRAAHHASHVMPYHSKH
jgi:hypothetical protein